MSDSENTDRLLSENEIMKLAYERFGLGAVKIIELLRDVPGIDKEKSE